MGSKQINDFTAKSTVTATDEYLLQETGGGTTKKTLISTIRDYILGYITSLTAKTTPVDADVIIINDSADSNNPKKVTAANFASYAVSTLSVPYPMGFTGLVLSNDTDTDHDINVTAGRCSDSTLAYTLELASEMTKQIDATWAAGDDAGGLDTGTVAADTWYYFFLIRKDSDASIDVLISASATSPTMPAGYTYKRRLRGAVLTDGSANITQFAQHNNYFVFNAKIADLSTTSMAITKTNFTVSTPDTITVIGMFSGNIREASARYVNVYDSGGDDRAATQDASDFLCEGGNQNKFEFTRIVENATISYKASVASADSFIINTIGFIDNAEL